MSFIAAYVRFMDRTSDLVGRAVSWLTLAMVVSAFAVVLLRYGFSVGWVWLQESYVWMHGVVFMLGAGYTLLHDAHVRVDVVYRTRGPRYRAFVDLVGTFLLLLPVTALVAWVSIPYVQASWLRLEASREAGGLPGLFLLKTVIPLFCVLLTAQGLALAGRALLVLTGREDVVDHDRGDEPR